MIDRLRADPATGQVPIIVVSVAADLTRDLAHGAADSLPKPIDEAALVDHVRRALRSGSQGSVLVASDGPDVRGMASSALDVAGEEAGSAVAAAVPASEPVGRRPDEEASAR